MSDIKNPDIADENEELLEGVKLVTYTMDPLMIYPIAPRIAKIVAPLLAHLSTMGELTEENIMRFLKSDIGKLGPMLETLSKSLGEKENATLPQELLKKTVAHVTVTDDETGTETVKKLALSDVKNINAVFRGHFFSMLRVMWHLIGVHFSDFSRGGSEASPIKE